MEREIVNRVAQSPLVTINLEDLYDHGEKVLYDLKDNLFEGLILKEKDFRAFLKSNDWSAYTDKHVAIYCSVDAIIPRWAYMLLAVYLEPYAKTIVYGDVAVLESHLFNIELSKIDPLNYKEKKVIIKGCSKYNVPQFAYVELTRILKPYAASIMYGEPCSTVPIFKQQKKK
ncbi:MAG: DUF2480 family protein [Cyclobacteriaceae bacterium]|nr:DUF2480 family protein [Cyclobacteriaceae bacterium]MCK5280567.1 DUF2480 family protein [Cyclobacteriaceae bacterium]MCK5368197.1 DUF2480 family protein [Cyclobacteriaceae bacterium]MCK5704665.1 DUF2480 family protein [Cyclobacteriaceae bacterium]